MRLPQIRFTVRRMMVVLLSIGVVIHLTVAAWRVRAPRTMHLHTAITVNDGGLPGTFSGVRSETFWPAYCRRLIGLTWREECGFADRALHLNLRAEKCELVNPAIRKPGHPRSFTPVLTRDQIELYISLSKNAGRDVRYENGRLVHRLP
jgi:hypothetical protein